MIQVNDIVKDFLYKALRNFSLKSNILSIFESEGKFKQSLLFLSFLDKPVEKDFLSYNRTNSLFQSRVASILGAIMYPSFLFLDVFLLPEEIYIFLIVRISISLIIIFSILLEYHKWVLKINESIPIVSLSVL